MFLACSECAEAKHNVLSMFWACKFLLYFERAEACFENAKACVEHAEAKSEPRVSWTNSILDSVCDFRGVPAPASVGQALAES